MSKLQALSTGAPIKNLMQASGKGQPNPFGWMFPGLPACQASSADLALLAKVMTAEKDAVLPENDSIPAGYTYLGQFINHDISVDTKSIMRGKVEPDHVRTPRLDLDSVYGTGPDAWPQLYVHEDGRDNGVKLKTHEDTPGSGDLDLRDLLREGGGDLGPVCTLIGDERNDENILVSQLHSSFISFHNAMVDKLREAQPRLSGRDLFERARREVRWHYQWVVLWDFLPRICGGGSYVQALVDFVARTRRLPRYRPSSRAFIPIEFWGAAFRIGHAMSRPSYFLNDVLDGPGKPINPLKPRLPVPLLVGDSPDPMDDLRGRRKIPCAWGVEWKYFFPFDEAIDADLPGAEGPEGRPGLPIRAPQPSLRIDHEIVAALANLPGKSRDGNGPNSVIRLDLQIGQDIGLPSGQTIAAAITGNREHLFWGKLQTTATDNLKAGVDRLPQNLVEDTPLFYYLLKEAEILEGGRCLGPVGRTIVAETLIGILLHNVGTILNTDPGWRPHAGAIPGQPYTMAHFLTFALPRRSSPPRPPWPTGAPVMV